MSAMKLKWCIFERVPPSGQDTVPGEYWQNALGTFDRKEKANSQIKKVKEQQPEFKNRELFAKQSRVA